MTKEKLLQDIEKVEKLASVEHCWLSNCSSCPLDTFYTKGETVENCFATKKDWLKKAKIELMLEDLLK